MKRCKKITHKIPTKMATPPQGKQSSRKTHKCSCRSLWKHWRAACNLKLAPLAKLLPEATGSVGLMLHWTALATRGMTPCM